MLSVRQVHEKEYERRYAEVSAGLSVKCSACGRVRARFSMKVINRALFCRDCEIQAAENMARVNAKIQSEADLSASTIDDPKQRDDADGPLAKEVIAMEFHEICSIFPLMTDEEFKGLCEDIRTNGLQNDIITYEGKIIDGRNRYNACLAVGVTPRMREWEGNGSPVAYVVSQNLKRRQLSTGQKAAIAESLLPHFEKEARERQVTSTGGAKPQLKERIPEAEKGQARDHAAKVVGVNPRYVSDAARIKKEDPALFEKVKSGEVSIPEAKKRVFKSRSKKKLAPHVQVKSEDRGEVGAVVEKMESEQSPWQKILSQLRELKAAIESAPEPTEEEREKVLSLLCEKTGNIQIPKCLFHRVFKVMQGTGCEDCLRANFPAAPDPTGPSSVEINPTENKPPQPEAPVVPAEKSILCRRNGGDRMNVSYCRDDCRNRMDCTDYLQWATGRGAGAGLAAEQRLSLCH